LYVPQDFCADIPGGVFSFVSTFLPDGTYFVSKLGNTDVDVSDLFSFGRCFLGDPCLLKRLCNLFVMKFRLKQDVKLYKQEEACPMPLLFSTTSKDPLLD
jgi:hypothetical protein